jgi:hypothetical protein
MTGHIEKARRRRGQEEEAVAAHDKWSPEREKLIN